MVPAGLGVPNEITQRGVTALLHALASSNFTVTKINFDRPGLPSTLVPTAMGRDPSQPAIETYTLGSGLELWIPPGCLPAADGREGLSPQVTVLDALLARNTSLAHLPAHARDACLLLHPRQVRRLLAAGRPCFLPALIGPDTRHCRDVAANNSPP